MDGYISDGRAYNLNTKRWRYLPTNNQLSARVGHTALTASNLTFEGSKGEYPIIIWGGQNRSGLLNDGAVYSKKSNNWKKISQARNNDIVNSTTGPSARTGHTAVWAEYSMLIWGGRGESGLLGDGRQYNYEKDFWIDFPTLGAPSPRIGHSAISTGTMMIVWGGELSGKKLSNDGAIFDTLNSKWIPITSVNAPLARTGHTAIWSGTEMIIFGGRTAQGETNTSSAYNPVTNKWRTLTLSGDPVPRTGHLAVWSGEEMFIFGGLSNGKAVDKLQRLEPETQNHYYIKKD